MPNWTWKRAINQAIPRIKNVFFLHEEKITQWNSKMWFPKFSYSKSSFSKNISSWASHRYIFRSGNGHFLAIPGVFEGVRCPYGLAHACVRSVRLRQFGCTGSVRSENNGVHIQPPTMPSYVYEIVLRIYFIVFMTKLIASPPPPPSLRPPHSCYTFDARLR